MTRNHIKKVAVGLSGGVDSSVTAYLLKEQGYDVTGIYMTCWEARVDGCRSDEDRKDAVRVAAKLGIKFESLDFIKPYKEKVIEYFYSEYKKGRTPNPDILCNKEIKFGLFLDWAAENGFDAIATGHYAQNEYINNSYKLLMGLDKTKDQSYFLYRLGQYELAKTLFPLGRYLKEDVRAIAKREDLHTYNKPDSVGICFIGEVDIKEFLKKHIKPKNGNVINTKGEIIGVHDGVWYYTIGQRHGFTITKYVGLPLYVVGKNIAKNELIVGFVQDASVDKFYVSDINWIVKKPQLPLKCMVRIRHLGLLYKAIISEISPDKLLISLEDSVFAIADGQSAVFYSENELLGGGIIN